MKEETGVSISHTATLKKIQQAEKLKSREMKEGWMKNDECWRMMISSCWGVSVNDGQMNKRTNGWTFVNLESLSRLKTFPTFSIQWKCQQAPPLNQTMQQTRDSHLHHCYQYYWNWYHEHSLPLPVPHCLCWCEVASI